MPSQPEASAAALTSAWIVSMSYAELVAASNFSFLRGTSHPEELIIQAKALGLEALALCDRNSLAGIVRAQGQAKKEGLRFIPGCRLALMESIEIACLPTSRAAYGLLCRLLTTGNRRAPKAQCFLWLEDVLHFGEGQIFIALRALVWNRRTFFATPCARSPGIINMRCWAAIAA
jgi:error-prone DNA polymerase